MIAPNRSSGYSTSVFIIQLALIGLYFLIPVNGLLWGAAGLGVLTVMIPRAGWVIDAIARVAAGEINRFGGVIVIGLFALGMLLFGLVRRIGISRARQRIPSQSQRL